MTLDDPRHGTEAGYAAHGRDGSRPCESCRRAKGRGDKKRRVYGSALTPVPADVHALIERVGVVALATRSGVSATAIGHIRKRGDKARAYPSTIARLRSVEIPTDLGTVRRVRALACLGWSTADIAAVAGEPISTILTLRDQEDRKVVGRDSLRDSIADAYRQLCMKRAPFTKWSSRIANNAARKGWAPPLAYDDIDDPADDPSTRDLELERWIKWWTSRGHADIDENVVARLLAGDTSVTATKPEKVEAMRRWLSWGRSETSLCAMHGWKDGRYVTREDDVA
jgi:hypothetical protein